MTDEIHPGTLEWALRLADDVEEWGGQIFTFIDEDYSESGRVVNYKGLAPSGNNIHLSRECGDNVFSKKYVFSLWVEKKNFEGPGYHGEVTIQKQKGKEVKIRELFNQVDAENYKQTLVSQDGVTIDF